MTAYVAIMEPGLDGKQWHLCFRCHEEGCRRKDGSLAGALPPSHPEQADPRRD